MHLSQTSGNFLRREGTCWIPAEREPHWVGWSIPIPLGEGGSSAKTTLPLCSPLFFCLSLPLSLSICLSHHLCHSVCLSLLVIWAQVQAEITCLTHAREPSADSEAKQLLHYTQDFFIMWSWAFFQVDLIIKLKTEKSQPCNQCVGEALTTDLPCSCLEETLPCSYILGSSKVLPPPRHTGLNPEPFHWITYPAPPFLFWGRVSLSY